MLETPHVALGVAIATKIPNPLISIPLSFASHFVLEFIPHWNPHLNSETEKYGKPTVKSTIITAADSTLALLLGSIIAFQPQNNPSQIINILLCSFFAILPDLVEAPYFFLNIRNAFIKKWIAFQKSLQVDTNIYFGMFNQILFTLFCLFWILGV